MSYVEVKSEKYNFNFHQLLHDNLLIMKKQCMNDWDFKILVSGDGMTRTGKSTIAAQISTIVDPTTTIDRVIFRGDKLISEALKIGKNKALIYDEAREGLDSKSAMTKYSKDILNYFSECGWLNQFLIIVLPEFFDLNKTVALNQSICLINCYCMKGFQRGYFEFYNRKDKRSLFIRGKKFNNYGAWGASYKGTFTKYFPFDEDEYNRRKLANQQEVKSKEKEKKVSQIDRIYFQKLAHNLNTEHKISQEEIARLSGFNYETLRYNLKKYRKLLKQESNEPKTA